MVVLLDANVLLDYLETREPYFEDSYQALLLCAEEKVSDSKLRETQTANYFSRYCPIDCAVPSASAQFCRKCGMLLS